MQTLYKKSLDFVGTVMHSFRFLYRCKPKIYYDDIQVFGFMNGSCGYNDITSSISWTRSILRGLEVFMLQYFLVVFQ